MVGREWCDFRPHFFRGTSIRITWPGAVRCGRPKVRGARRGQSPLDWAGIPEKDAADEPDGQARQRGAHDGLLRNYN